MKIHCLYDKLIDPRLLKQHVKNRNKHPKDQIERLAKILSYQGWRYPIKISNLSHQITSGHGRLMAALKLNLKEVPVVYQDYENTDQEIADLTADNAIASWSELDIAGLNLDVPDLGPDFDIEMLGLRDFTIDMADKQGLTDEDDVPEIKESFVKPGEIWKLGDHRLMCGDSTDIKQVEALMAGGKVDITFTSPPYNAGAAPGGLEHSRHRKYLNYELDNRTEIEYLNFLNSFLENARIFSKCQLINISMLEGGKRPIIDWLYQNKNFYLDQMIWKKASAAPSPPNVLTHNHEHIFIFSSEKNPNRRLVSNDFKHSFSVIETALNSNNENADIHQATFPIIFCEKVFDISCPSKGSVYDSFGGSGSTLIACEKTNRKCFMMELDTHYCGVIIERWQKFTGQRAVRANER